MQYIYLFFLFTYYFFDYLTPSKLAVIIADVSFCAPAVNIILIVILHHFYSIFICCFSCSCYHLVSMTKNYRRLISRLAGIWFTRLALAINTGLVWVQFGQIILDQLAMSDRHLIMDKIYLSIYCSLAALATTNSVSLSHQRLQVWRKRISSFYNNIILA